MQPILEVRGIYKYYGDFAANKDINLTVNKGSVHAIVGENGAGKSTLMNLLAGVLSPTEGEIVLNGKPQRFANADDATHAGIGMVQQEFMLFEELSVLENIVIGYEDTKGIFLDPKSNEKKVREICEEYGFDFNLKAKAHTLPIVKQQQVEIVKVLYKKAEIIILDEPTSVLPPQEVEGLFRAIRFLVEQGKTVLFITHKLKEVLAISDTITVMKAGRVVDTIPAKGATERQLTSMMVGRDIMLEVEKKPVSSEETVLEVNNLTVSDAKGILRVKDVSFKLHAGEILGVVGISGNGQNELVESLTGMRKYDEGSVLLYDLPLAQDNPRENRLKGLGYVPQDRIQVGSARQSSLIENAVAGRHLTDFIKGKILLDYPACEQYTQEIANKYDVRNQGLELGANSLSGGNLQKLIVGREFSMGNKVLIVEDPTRGIDVGAIEFIWGEIIRQAEEEGVAVLLITYDLNEAITLSDRLVVMYDGTICKEMQGPDYDEKEIGLYMLGGADNVEKAI
jgi:ABC-type uncharacterized transport systems, ATPase components